MLVEILTIAAINITLAGILVIAILCTLGWLEEDFDDES